MRLTERNPLIIGIVAIIVILIGTFAALTIKGDTFAPGYSISANFQDTSGLMGGDLVTIAGVQVGHIGSIAQDGNAVKVTLKINHGVQIAEGTTAAIQVETLLGRKGVALQAPQNADWTKLMKSGEHIPGLGTSPTEVLDVQADAQSALATLDANTLNQFLSDLATVTTGKQSQVEQIIDGLGKLTATVNDRSDAVSSLIDAANAVSSTVEAHNANLLSAVDNLDSVVENLSARRDELTQLLATTQDAASKLSTVIGNNRNQLTTVLSQLEGVLGIVNQHQVDLAQTVSYLAGAVEGFSSIGYSGPADTPNTWANIFTVGLGPASGDPLFGCDGEFDALLTIVVGPDPVTNCAQYSGPIPGGVSSGVVQPAPSAALPRGKPGSVIPADAATTRDGLDALLVPLLSTVAK